MGNGQWSTVEDRNQAERRARRRRDGPSVAIGGPVGRLRINRQASAEKSPGTFSCSLHTLALRHSSRTPLP